MKHQKHLRQPHAIIVYSLFFLLSGCSQAPAIYKVRGQPLLSHKIKSTIDLSGYQSDFLTALPQAGLDGTLENRMENDPVRGKILAKTGTLSGASCLSGYVFIKAGDPLAFSIMMNGYVGSSGPYRQLQDDICTILTNH
ncbi:MAG: D-alanyl-D-alanine carboxypeptidase [Candidatus Marinimicrobia bacterium]|nr:D-alanyl-D-alanine carboxypeptidase [Candidatus Neomarinimicrobiota bacterium]